MTTHELEYVPIDDMVRIQSPRFMQAISLGCLLTCIIFGCFLYKTTSGAYMGDAVLLPGKTNMIRAKVPGMVERILVTEGQLVGAQEEIVVVQDMDASKTLETKSLEYREAATSMLRGSSTSSKAENYMRARKELGNSWSRFKEQRVRAMADGTVSRLYVHSGEFVKRSQLLASVRRTGSVGATVISTMPIEVAQFLRKGDLCTFVSSEKSKVKFEVRVLSISQEADSSLNPLEQNSQAELAVPSVQVTGSALALDGQRTEWSKLLGNYPGRLSCRDNRRTVFRSLLELIGA